MSGFDLLPFAQSAVSTRLSISHSIEINRNLDHLMRRSTLRPFEGSGQLLCRIHHMHMLDVHMIPTKCIWKYEKKNRINKLKVSDLLSEIRKSRREFSKEI